MPVLEQSVVVVARREKVWACVSDVSRWSGIQPDSSERFRVSVRLLEGSGQGAKVGVFNGAEKFQEWVVDEWVPPQRAAASCRWCKDRLTAMSSSLRFSLATVSPSETKVDVRLELELSHPVFRWLNDLPFIRAGVEDALANFLRRLPGQVDAMPEPGASPPRAEAAASPPEAPPGQGSPFWKPGPEPPAGA